MAPAKGREALGTLEVGMVTMVEFDHLNIVVGDMAASVGFYRTLFGMEVALDDQLQGDWFEAVTGLPGARAHCVILRGRESGLRIELLHYLNPPGRPHAATLDLTTTGLRHFAVRVGNLEASLALARGLGYAQGVAPVEVPRALLPAGKRMAYLRDPDGVVLELAEYGGPH